MPLLMLKSLPRYECLLEAAKEFPDLDPSAAEAFLHLLRAGDEAFAVTEKHLSQHNITQGRFTVMMILMNTARGGCDCQPLSPATLADRTGVTRATMTGLIDTLERDGLVKREPHAQDRRMMAVQLTPKGEAVLHQLLPGYFQQMSALMQPLTLAERRTLVNLLAKMIMRKAPETDSTANPCDAEASDIAELQR